MGVERIEEERVKEKEEEVLFYEEAKKHLHFPIVEFAIFMLSREQRQEEIKGEEERGVCVGSQFFFNDDYDDTPSVWSLLWWTSMTMGYLLDGMMGCTLNASLPSLPPPPSTLLSYLLSCVG